MKNRNELMVYCKPANVTWLEDIKKIQNESLYSVTYLRHLASGGRGEFLKEKYSQYFHNGFIKGGDLKSMLYSVRRVISYKSWISSLIAMGYNRKNIKVRLALRKDGSINYLNNKRIKRVVGTQKVVNKPTVTKYDVSIFPYVLLISVSLIFIFYALSIGYLIVSSY